MALATTGIRFSQTTADCSPYSEISIAFNQAVRLRFVNLLAVCELTLYKNEQMARERRAPRSLAIRFKAQANGLVERAPV